jgi:hypothetical protein
MARWKIEAAGVAAAAEAVNGNDIPNARGPAARTSPGSQRQTQLWSVPDE